MSESQAYFKAMLANNTDACARIEQKYDLYGYPPELVSVGLRAVDEGKDPEEAVAAYLADGGPAS